jgi:hypothetical protein
MRESESKQLSEPQQLLLSSYVDNQCSFVARMRAERLIRQSEHARLFVESLKKTSQAYRSLFSTPTASPDLWDKINTRINAEERAALYLGQRKPVATANEGSFASHFFSKQALFGGLSGAAIAACVLVLISRPTKSGEIIPVYTGGPVAAQNASAFHQASLGAPQREVAPGSSMEVDWMRSNGSLKIIQSPNDKSAILWVRRKGATSGANARGIKPTPTIRVVREEGVDVTPLGTAK